MIAVCERKHSNYVLIFKLFEDVGLSCGKNAIINWKQEKFSPIIILLQSKLYDVLMSRTYNEDDDRMVVEEKTSPGGRRETVERENTDEKDSRSSPRIVCKTSFQCSL